VKGLSNAIMAARKTGCIKEWEWLPLVLPCPYVRCSWGCRYPLHHRDTREPGPSSL
ncbi:hypothetical protein KI387_001080, partial [Taxus chinensis]